MHRNFINLIGHGVVMEGNRKMTGCLQTFGGHCIIHISPPTDYILKSFYVKWTKQLFNLSQQKI